MRSAFRRFEATRKERTTRVQQTSRTNTWLKDKTDTDWVYAYDAWTAPVGGVAVGAPADMASELAVSLMEIERRPFRMDNIRRPSSDGLALRPAPYFVKLTGLSVNGPGSFPLLSPMM